MNKNIESKVSHPCGCVSVKSKKGILSLEKVCSLHEKNKHAIWIVLQHDKKSKEKKVKQAAESKLLRRR